MCDTINHNLITIAIYDINYAANECGVVRWCKDCGAIVVDVDVDEITYPGAIKKMKFPAYEFVKHIPIKFKRTMDKSLASGSK